jgi:Response regulator containing CheY-like receiver, AAA-type ATPase, and DNA-binding domains
MSAKSRILSITYDESLLRTRELILRKAGFDVTSALGFVEARSLCAANRFDLVVVGHSIPVDDKIAILKFAKEGCSAATLCLRKPNSRVLPEADYSTDKTDPRGLVEAVNAALAGVHAARKRAPRRS